jgi:hypothetical protein
MSVHAVEVMTSPTTRRPLGKPARGRGRALQAVLEVIPTHYTPPTPQDNDGSTAGISCSSVPKPSSFFSS